MKKRETDPDGEALRALYRASVQRAGSSDCPNEERLGALVLGEVAGEEHTRLADHVVACTACTETTRLLMELHHAAGGSRRSWLGSSWVRLLAAAVVLVALGLLLRGTPPPGDVERGAGTVATAPADGVTLDAAPASLEWAAAPGATAYRVRLYDARAEPLWESEPGVEPRVALPPEARAGLSPGSAYFWTVELEVEAASTPSRLGPFWFRLAPR